LKIELILLAAGKSKRFGGIKQLTDINGQPMICHCLSQFRQSGQWIDGITNGYVVLGSNAELIAQVLPTTINKHVASYWQQGMGQTLAESMQIIASDTTHVLIALADQVAINQPIIMSMLEESVSHPAHIVAAEYAGRVGAPAIFPRQYFSQLSQLTGDIGAKALLQEYPKQTISLVIPEAAFDIDIPEDLKSFS
jgi:molybdenum cofactor cytidylyltransferase